MWVVCARACVRARGFHALSQLPDRVQGVTNFERALTIADDGNADAQNEYGILLTKRAQRILKQLRREGFDPAAVNHTPAAPAEPQPEADPSSAESSAQPEGELPIETEEEKEAARRAERCAELVARANRYFDAAEAKFVELYETSVWFGTINLACLAALRGREEETRRWLRVCRDQHDLVPEHLDDHDFDAYRDRPGSASCGPSLSSSASPNNAKRKRNARPSCGNTPKKLRLSPVPLMAKPRRSVGQRKCRQK